MRKKKVEVRKEELEQKEPPEEKTRLQAILSEEAEKILIALQSDEKLGQDHGSVEEFLSGQMSAPFKNALERYKLEQTEVADPGASISNDA